MATAAARFSYLQVVDSAVDADISTSAATSTTPPLPPRLFYHPPSVLAAFFRLHPRPPHPPAPPFLPARLLASLRCSLDLPSISYVGSGDQFAAARNSSRSVIDSSSGRECLSSGNYSRRHKRMGAPLISRAVAPRIFTNGMLRARFSLSLPLFLPFCSSLSLKGFNCSRSLRVGEFCEINRE